MKVTVLGCSGAMGSYFVHQFLAQGYDVTGSDTRRGTRPPRGLAFASSNREAVRDADAVLLAVPIRDTVKVAREVAPHLRDGSLVVEIASVKAKVHGELRKTLAARNVSLLSVHPLFGPLSKSPRPKIYVIGSNRNVLVARSLFPRAQLIPLGAREHDRLVAYALSLVHLLNLAFVSSVSKDVGVGKFARMATPLGAAQLKLAKAILSQDPSLYSYIQLENPFVKEILSSLIGELERLRNVIANKDAREFEKRFAALSDKFARVELDAALKSIYSTSG